MCIVLIFRDFNFACDIDFSLVTN